MSEERFDLVIRGRRILTTAGIAPREVGVRNGRIVALEPLGNGLAGAEVIELADDETLLPGLVDTHVHVNEPGRTEWEGFASATRAAAAGGVTTIIDMPLNSVPPTTTVENLKLKREVAEDQAFVDVGFWGGAIPGNKADLRPLHDEGVFGFKCFLLHSGVDEFPHLDADEMEEDMAELKSFDSLMIVHAEDSHAIDRAPHPGGDHYSTCREPVMTVLGPALSSRNPPMTAPMAATTFPKMAKKMTCGGANPNVPAAMMPPNVKTAASPSRNTALASRK